MDWPRFHEALHLLITPANEQERVQVAALSQAVQDVTGESIEVAFVDQGYTGAQAQQAAAEQGIELSVVKLQEAKRGFVLLPRRWVESLPAIAAEPLPEGGRAQLRLDGSVSSSGKGLRAPR